MEILLVSSLSYLSGSIPFGLILTKIFSNKDVRKIGSGNIGATNVLRSGNKLIGYTTLLLDILKAILPVIEQSLLEKLVEALRCMPGIGKKSARGLIPLFCSLDFASLAPSLILLILSLLTREVLGRSCFFTSVTGDSLSLFRTI